MANITASLNASIVAGDGLTGNGALTKLITGLSFATAVNMQYLFPETIGVAPPAQPVCTPGTGGSMTSGNYLVKITYVNAPQGESLPSVESASQTVSSSGTLVVTSPAASSPATAYNVYITASGGSTGTETLQNVAPIAIGTNYTQTAAVSAGAALPGANTTLVFQFTLPQSPAQAVYVRNLSTSSQVASVAWTKQGGTSVAVCDLIAGAAGVGSSIMLWEVAAGTNQGGITAVNVTVSAVQAVVDAFFAG